MINMSLDDRSGRIKHDSAKSVPIQVAADIEADIEAELATQYGVARVSIRRAIELLRERGKVLTFHGRGTYVAEKSGELSAYAAVGACGDDSRLSVWLTSCRSLQHWTAKTRRSS
jgi:DNA-binding FadR family transcriptional regulator